MRFFPAIVSLVLTAQLAWADAPAAPLVLKPVLDQAAALEHDGDFGAALALYRQALEMVPGSRHAWLGVARIARAQFRLGDAADIYKELLERDPSDLEARNGMAWIDLANHRDASARAGFDAVLALQPNNEEARAALAIADSARRYSFDLSGGPTNNTFGTAWGAVADFTAALDAYNTVEASVRTNSNELRTNNPLDASTLPSRAARIGYRWQRPAQYGFAVGYEDRQRDTSPTERLVDFSAQAAVTGKVGAFAGQRRGYGTGFESQVTFTGLTYRFTEAWSVTSTFFSAKSSTPALPDPKAVVLDAIYGGPGDLLVIVGASQGKDPSLSDIHGRLVYPLHKDSALLVTARSNTFNSESQIEVGWRQYWK